MVVQQYQGQRRQGRGTNGDRAMGRGRRQTERIINRQARSIRQAANGQRGIISPGNTQVNKQGINARKC